MSSPWEVLPLLPTEQRRLVKLERKVSCSLKWMDLWWGNQEVENVIKPPSMKFIYSHMQPQRQIRSWLIICSCLLCFSPHLLIHTVVDILLWSLSTCRVKSGVKLMCEWMVHLLGITSKIHNRVPRAWERALISAPRTELLLWRWEFPTRNSSPAREVFSLKISLFLSVSYIFFVQIHQRSFFESSSTFWSYSSEDWEFLQNAKPQPYMFFHKCLHYCMCKKNKK